ncbi:hypothetical protein MAMC_00338 [Methylacidimicrobium cyclopophantes]|uniref:Uncharacterized protein n=1 Tax=Methylacidimicrobium cyclopophantes TaxID=1041766 RepID=A0A5E6M6I3_9BACT|nr:hypothetical protein MAMC_00338 [Methylacidimicrobium cyclopophantes]
MARFGVCYVFLSMDSAYPWKRLFLHAFRALHC